MYLLIENFNAGMDARRMAVTSRPGTLQELSNCHITRGGEIEKRKAFTKIAQLPDNTFGLHQAQGQLWTFGSDASPSIPESTLPEDVDPNDPNVFVPLVNYMQLRGAGLEAKISLNATLIESPVSVDTATQVLRVALASHGLQNNFLYNLSVGGVYANYAVTVVTVDVFTIASTAATGTTVISAGRSTSSTTQQTVGRTLTITHAPTMRPRKYTAGQLVTLKFPSNSTFDGSYYVQTGGTSSFSISSTAFTAGLTSVIVDASIQTATVSLAPTLSYFVSGSLREISGCAMDSSGNLYGISSTQSIIYKVTSAGTVTTFAGQYGVPGNANGTGTGATFTQPSGIAIDASGNLFVSQANAVIRKITPAGVVTNFAGTAATYGTTDATGTSARFASGLGQLGFSSVGDLYVADTGSHTIRKITSGGVVTTFAGGAGVSGSTDATGTAARFSSPNAVVCDSLDNVFVLDAGNHTIRKITSAGVVTLFSGSVGVSTPHDDVPASATYSVMNSVAIDYADTLYVSGGDASIRAVPTLGASTSTVLSAILIDFLGVCVSPDGVLYVASVINDGVFSLPLFTHLISAPVPWVQELTGDVDSRNSTALALATAINTRSTYHGFTAAASSGVVTVYHQTGGVDAHTGVPSGAGDVLFIYSKSSLASSTLDAGPASALVITGVEMTKLIHSENYAGKIYCIAEFDSNRTLHFFDGERVLSWGTIALSGDNNAIALSLANRIFQDGAYSSTSSGNVISIAFTQRDVGHFVTARTTNGGFTSDEVITVANVQSATADHPEIWTCTIGGTYEVGDIFTVTVDNLEYSIAAGSSSIGVFSRTHNNKMYSTANSLLYFSETDTNGGASAFTLETTKGSGVINMANQDSGSETLTSLEVYQGKLAVFSKNAIQIWTMDADPNLNARSQILTNIGTFAPKSVVSLGNVDTYFLSSSGVRSLRARDASNAAIVSDIGNSIDDIVQTDLRRLPQAYRSAAVGIIEPVEGRYWLCLGSRVYVYSYYPTPNISAWSTYDLSVVPEAFDLLTDAGSGVQVSFEFADVSFISSDATKYTVKANGVVIAPNTGYTIRSNGTGGTIVDLVVAPGEDGTVEVAANTYSIQYIVSLNQRMYARSDTGALLAYGGYNGVTYDDCPVSVIMPYLDGGKPAHNKQMTAIDSACIGTWRVYLGMDVQYPDSRADLGSITNTTYSYGRISARGRGTHIGIQMTNSTAEYAKIGNFVAHFEINDSQ